MHLLKGAIAEYYRLAARYRFVDEAKHGNFESAQAEPTVSAGAHSGHMRLNYVLVDADVFNDLSSCCGDVPDLEAS